MNYITPYTLLYAMTANIGMGAVDVFVKGWIVMKFILPRYGNNWADLPDFWKDHIDNDSLLRIRWVYVLSIGGIIITVYTMGWIVGGITLILMGGLWEHVWYEWIGTAIFGWYRKNWGWLHEKPYWLISYPILKLLMNIRGHDEPTAGDVAILATTAIIVTTTLTVIL